MAGGKMDPPDCQCTRCIVLREDKRKRRKKRQEQTEYDSYSGTPLARPVGKVQIKPRSPVTIPTKVVGYRSVNVFPIV